MSSVCVELNTWSVTKDVRQGMSLLRRQKCKGPALTVRKLKSALETGQCVVVDPSTSAAKAAKTSDLPCLLKMSASTSPSMKSADCSATRRSATATSAGGVAMKGNDSFRRMSPTVPISPSGKTSDSPVNLLNRRGSPTVAGHYAGAKFSEPPAADCLPRPPSHWTLDHASMQLKLLLNVNA